MKITFLNLAAADDWGGGEQWTLRAARGLLQRGHSVNVIGRQGRGMAERARASGLDADSVPVGCDYAPHTVLAIYRLLRRHRPDVLVVHHNKDVRTGGVAANLAGIPVLHRNGFPILRNNPRHRLTYRLTNRILTNSHRIRERYLTYGWIDPDRIDVVPNGIQLSPRTDVEDRSQIRAAWGIGPDNLLAVYAGRLTGIKRVADLLEAFAALGRQSRWRLVVMGRGSEETQLRRRANGDDLRSRIRILGFRSDAALQFHAADLLVLPSSEEGMPNALMEAMAIEVPVAATPVGDVPFLLDQGKAGWL
ncbi:MAG: glycosyltransferase, partial [Candidatus Eisenbacteria sp.]|nr:glycosyltransferase [Candidatus Eisenbacteria bacterium]